MPGTRIGDFQIEVNKLPTMQGVKLSARIGRIIGPALAKGFQNGMEGEVDLGVIAALFFDRVHPDELEAVLRELLSCTTCNGKPIMDVFDVLFADKLELVIPLVKYVMTFQLGSFFDALLSAGRAHQAKAESASTSTTS